ncbi:hypothetical protein CONCODRAFT_4399 [Conidiobolus coronatus NRRL 28638]|uniref:Uncharacterized protein n=1 Tax=Conidiobolus coronatus (strain ATCC 28846 / CBS 209.66 / NRRL 28638) TaxID=796925 RepID=A0A137PCX2_CONC2|nr:hypothetical protein CONCODRAFT_4399 [Conidiobolus coronatus NRRL 28638]|eukprot:KXN72791.1 hypothetical protein CONCODRAFT_4399 [Conidiobolus coronatus NRRL 28638]
MKILYYFPPLFLNAWVIELKVKYWNGLLGHSWEYFADIVSDMGGKAQLSCIAFNEAEKRCKHEPIAWSSQGGYNIYDLKCKNGGCTLQLYVENINLELEVDSNNDFEDGQFRPTEESYKEYYGKREFKVWSDNRIEYTS